MSPFATVKSLKRARGVIKGMMNHYPGELTSLEEASRGGVRLAIEQLMQERTARYLEEQLEAGVQDRRNGYCRRHLLTGMGDVELAVPRTRHWSAAAVLDAYARRTPQVDRCIMAAFVLGLSTRKVAEALLPMFQERVSASTVSRVAKVLDEAVVGFHRRPLSNRYRVLLFDGVVLSRKTGQGVNRRPVLVALGILPNGRKEVIDFLLARDESQVAWEGLLNELYQRGLTGEGVELIGIDGCKGLANALAVVYPRIPVQRCWAHKMRNMSTISKSDPLRSREMTPLPWCLLRPGSADWAGRSFSARKRPHRKLPDRRSPSPPMSE